MMVVKDLEMLPKYAVTGLAMSLLANRLSWFFNLSGPSVNVDSACSSSMMAFDLACQGLRNRDSTMVNSKRTNIILFTNANEGTRRWVQLYSRAGALPYVDEYEFSFS